MKRTSIAVFLLLAACFPCDAAERLGMVVAVGENGVTVRMPGFRRVVLIPSEARFFDYLARPLPRRPDGNTLTRNGFQPNQPVNVRYSIINGTLRIHEAYLLRRGDGDWRVHNVGALSR